MKKIFYFSAIALLIYACGSESKKEENKEESKEEKGFSGLSDMSKDTAGYADDAKGIGKFKNVELPPTLDTKMAALGSGIYDLKCSSCHKLTKERLVGPGWSGVTSRRKPEWIMNFVTNTDEMLNKNAEAQAMLEICMVRMPNQSLSDDDARAIVEFMRKNDGVK
jgi:cytochrome c5